MGQCFGGIQRFTTADTQHRLAIGTFRQLAQAVDFILGAFAAKGCNFDMQFSIFEAFTQSLFSKTENEFIADDEPTCGQGL
ncbi:hypothetical protein D3C85_1542960 [compost metagenome]